MPIVAVFEFPGEDVAKYHKVFEVGGAPILEQPDRLSHICYRTDGGWTVVDVWEDEAQLRRVRRDHRPRHRRRRSRRQAPRLPARGHDLARRHPHDLLKRSPSSVGEPIAPPVSCVRGSP